MPAARLMIFRWFCRASQRHIRSSITGSSDCLQTTDATCSRPSVLMVKKKDHCVARFYFNLQHRLLRARHGPLPSIPPPESPSSHATSTRAPCYAARQAGSPALARHHASSRFGSYPHEERAVAKGAHQHALYRPGVHHPAGQGYRSAGRHAHLDVVSRPATSLNPLGDCEDGCEHPDAAPKEYVDGPERDKPDGGEDAPVVALEAASSDEVDWGEQKRRSVHVPVRGREASLWSVQRVDTLFESMAAEAAAAAAGM